jgi:hypothetical protein
MEYDFVIPDGVTEGSARVVVTDEPGAPLLHVLITEKRDEPPRFNIRIGSDAVAGQISIEKARAIATDLIHAVGQIRRRMLCEAGV